MSKEIGDQYLISCSRFFVEKYKRMLSEDGDSNSIRNSSSSRDSDSSTDSNPNKRRRRLPVFTAIEDLMKIDAEDILVKDYGDWFMSLGAGVDEDQILWPQNYCEWFSKLGSEAKADVVHPFNYIEWYVTKFDKAAPMVYRSSADVIEGYAQDALEYFNEINKCDYEYVRDVALNQCGNSSHLNFYGRLKVSPSRTESEAPQRLFFADVDYEYTVLECRIVDSDEFGDASVLHPPDDTYCAVCRSGHRTPLEVS